MESWIIGGILALFIIVPCWLALSRRKEVQRQVQGWVELAERTGLVFDPNIFNVPVRVDHYPGLRGEYRGRSLTVKLFGDSERNAPPNTWILLGVQNGAHFSLSIRAKTFHEHIHKIMDVSSGDLDFDRRFGIKGSPQEYLQGAAERIVRSNPSLLAWIKSNIPCIELKEDTLVCSQNGELTNVDNQLALLNLFCDLAELAEQMGGIAEQQVIRD